LIAIMIKHADVPTFWSVCT